MLFRSVSQSRYVDVGETVSPILKGYEHNPSVMEFNELVDALTRLAAKY